MYKKLNNFWQFLRPDSTNLKKNIKAGAVEQATKKLLSKTGAFR